jgi:hypothetical protein
MKIVYYLLTHKSPRQIERLVDRLRTGSNGFVLIHHDQSKGIPLSITDSSDVHIMRDHLPVKWGHISLTLAMLRGIEWLGEESFNFDWLLIISGQDYPMKRIGKIESFLGTTTFDAFVHHELIHEDPAFHERYYQTLCMRRYFCRRIKIPGLRPVFVKRRHPYRFMNCYAGSQWLNLSRRAVEYLWSKGETLGYLLRYLRRVECPDETLFQTVLLNGSNLDIANDDKRFIVWREDDDHPQILSLEHLREMADSDAWFARKVDEEVCPGILDSLDGMIATSPGGKRQRDRS